MTATNFREDSGAEEPGHIAYWHGTLYEIPKGWVLADGNNQTPDLTNKFVKPPADYSNGSGASGGQNSYSMSEAQLPSHDHTGDYYSNGGHDHTINTFSHEPENWNADWFVSSNGDHQQNTSSISNHSHGSTYSDNTGSGNSVDNRPQHYEAAVIIKL